MYNILHIFLVATPAANGVGTSGIIAIILVSLLILVGIAIATVCIMRAVKSRNATSKPAHENKQPHYENNDITLNSSSAPEHIEVHENGDLYQDISVDDVVISGVGNDSSYEMLGESKHHSVPGVYESLDDKGNKIYYNVENLSTCV